MNKEKIAITMDGNLLNVVDKKVDGKTFQSRSQAIEFFLRKGMAESIVDKAIVMLRADQHKDVIEHPSFWKRQLEFLKKSGIRTIVFTTQNSTLISKFKKMTEDHGFEVRVYENKTLNNAHALLSVKNEFTHDCLVVSGDVLNDFDVKAMVQKHFQLGKLVTMGLISKPQTKTEGSAVVDGDYVIQFHEKSEHFITNIVNAGIYIIKPEALTLLEGKQNVEHELFPKLAKLKQLVGFFIYGGYEHLR